ncbi:MAG TPA: AsmA family protein [Methylotenera sp.]|nr:AsmA family protein [Methylotenera sp.]
MKKNKKILIVLGLLISVLILLPFLIPVQTYLQEAEKVASEKLGVPVTIGGGHLAFLPSPRIVLKDISVGEHQEAQFGRVVAIPTISTLFSDTKVIDIKIAKPVIKKAALDIVTALTSKKSEGNEPSPVNIHHININDLELLWPEAKYPVLDIEATLKNGSQLESAIVETKDGKVKANVTPNGDEQLIVITANKWAVPVGLPLLIDNAKLEAHLKGSRLEIPNIDIALYKGKLTGDAVLTWGKSWKVTGKLKVDNLSVKEPSSMVSKSVYLSGNLFGNGKFSAVAKDAGNLGDNLHADFKFKVNDGVLHGLDLVKAASLLLKQGQSGGSTEFDEFSGLLNVLGKQYHLRDLKISSGLISADGQVKISPKEELDGTVKVEVKNSMSMAAIPLDVSGTLNDPIVFPSKAALAGAIAGTAMLGPGVGTSLGSKAGEAVGKLKGLFGGDE